MTTPQDPWQSPDAQAPRQPQPGPGAPQYGYGSGPQMPPPYGGQQMPVAPPMYPPGAYMPPPQRPPMPSTVRNAVVFMYAGMAVALIQGIVTATQASEINARINDQLGLNQTASGFHGFTIGTGGGSSVVGGVVLAGLWLWMALICRLGRNWGRIVSTVFFGLGCFNLIGLFFPYDPPIIKVFQVVSVVIGLIAIVLVWKSESASYFRPQSMMYPYGYAPGQAPYGQQPPYGQPGQYGQPGPYGQGQPGQSPYGQQPPYGQG